LCQSRPEAVIVSLDPSLRIVPQALWNKVEARQRAQSEKYGMAVRKGLQREMRRGSARAPKYLLSSLLKCGACGAHFVMTNRAYYSWSTYRGGGPAACSNHVLVHRETAEAASSRP
jgi:hypothetical protein